MAFALWIERDVAVAAGTHEYRAMGVAVIAVSDRFRHRDFRGAKRAPSRRLTTFQGLFASLEEVNRFIGRTQRRNNRRFLGRQLSVT